MADIELSTVNGPGTTPVVAMVGEFDMSNARLVDDVLVLWTAQGHSEAVIDLTRTEFIDAATIDVLVKTHARGLSLTLQGASGAVRRVLDLTWATAESDPR